MNFGQWSPKFAAGNRKFLTKRLWGAANEPPYYHHGRFTVIEFLKTLQVLPPGTKDLVVDENYKAREWPPR